MPKAKDNDYWILQEQTAYKGMILTTVTRLIAFSELCFTNRLVLIAWYFNIPKTIWSFQQIQKNFW